MNNLSSAVSTEFKLQMAFSVRSEIRFRKIEKFQSYQAGFRKRAQMASQLRRIMTFVERVRFVRTETR